MVIAVDSLLIGGRAVGVRDHQREADRARTLDVQLGQTGVVHHVVRGVPAAALHHLDVVDVDGGQIAREVRVPGSGVVHPAGGHGLCLGGSVLGDGAGTVCLQDRSCKDGVTFAGGRITKLREEARERNLGVVRVLRRNTELVALHAGGVMVRVVPLHGVAGPVSARRTADSGPGRAGGRGRGSCPAESQDEYQEEPEDRGGDRGEHTYGAIVHCFTLREADTAGPVRGLSGVVGPVDATVAPDEVAEALRLLLLQLLSGRAGPGGRVAAVVVVAVVVALALEARSERQDGEHDRGSDQAGDGLGREGLLGDAQVEAGGRDVVRLVVQVGDGDVRGLVVPVAERQQTGHEDPDTERVQQVDRLEAVVVAAALELVDVFPELGDLIVVPVDPDLQADERLEQVGEHRGVVGDVDVTLAEHVAQRREHLGDLGAAVAAAVERGAERRGRVRAGLARRVGRVDCSRDVRDRLVVVAQDPSGFV